MKKASFSTKILLIINGLIGGLLVLSVVSKHLPPTYCWPIAFVGLFFPILFITNMLFAIYWAITFKRWVVLSLIFTAISWQDLPTYFQWSKATPAPTGHKVKVMSYNVRVFDLYNWTGNTQTRNNIFKTISREAPDILCFQEFYYAKEKGYFETLDTLLTFQKATNYHAAYTAIKKEHQQHFGIATFTSYPIVHKGEIAFNNTKNNSCIYTDIKIGTDTLRVYNIHLASVRLKGSFEDPLKDIYEGDMDQKKSGFKLLFERLKMAFQQRVSQSQLVAEHIQSSPHPVVVCGDFNDTANSYSYRKLAHQLVDAFVHSGKGMGITYNGKIPLLRIDYLLHSPQLQSANFTTLKDPYSDHFPLTCNIFLEDL